MAGRDNFLDACGVITTATSNIHVDRLLLLPSLIRPHQKEETTQTIQRLRCVVKAWPDKANLVPDEDLSILRELFGPAFLTNRYHLSEVEVLEEL